MSPMHHYLQYKSNIILKNNDGFTRFSMQMSVCQQSVLKVTWLAGMTYFYKKLLQSNIFI